MISTARKVPRSQSAVPEVQKEDQAECDGTGHRRGEHQQNPVAQEFRASNTPRVAHVSSATSPVNRSMNTDE